MAATVTWCKELAMVESTDADAAESQRRVREWEVCLSAPDSTGADIAKTGTGIPAIGTAYGTTALRVLTLSAKLKDRTNRKVYTVTAEYGIKQNPDGSPSTTAPWSRSPVYSYSPVEYEYELQKDFTSPTRKPIVNGAGDLFATTIKARRVNMLVTKQYAATSFNLSSYFGRIGTLSSDGNSLFRDVRMETATWIDSVGVETTYYNISLSWETACTADGFDINVINAGYRLKKNDGTLERATEKDKNGKPFPSAGPVLLSADGTSIVTTPNYITFKPYPTGSWSPE